MTGGPGPGARPADRGAGDRAPASLAEAVALVEQLRDQLAALAEQYDEEHPGMEIVEARAVIEAADEFLLSQRPQEGTAPG